MSVPVEWWDSVEIVLVTAVWLAGVACGSFAWSQRIVVSRSRSQAPGLLPNRRIREASGARSIKSDILRPNVTILTHIKMAAIGTAAPTFEAFRQFFIERRSPPEVSFRSLEHKSLKLLYIHED
ncbi:hypothetical protein [Lichenicoccus sp.]|uniref:hypothetical protein n=1 Tax=Lichenicoccus sp. TaxID=2781899 RepID=UPI003D0C7933